MTNSAGCIGVLSIVMAVLVFCDKNSTEPERSPAPSGLSVADTSSTAVTISWNRAAGAGFYIVYRDGSAMALDTVSDTTFTNQGLQAGTSYTYRVASLVNGVVSAESSPLTVTFCPPPVAGTGMVLVTPNGCETYHVGDTMEITWSIGTTRSPLVIEFARDAFSPYTVLTPSYIDVSAPTYPRGPFRWVIPDSLTDLYSQTQMSTVTDSGIVYIHEYMLGGYQDYCDWPVVIQAKGSP